MKKHDAGHRGRALLLTVLIVWNIVVIGGILLLPDKTETGRASTIGSLYTIAGEPFGMQPVMEAMTVHGSVQYYANGEDWLYFEQMAGGLRITLGKNAEHVNYTEFERGGIRYTLAEEPLGSELAWENADGYLFYLYSSLPAQELTEVADAIIRTEDAP